MYYAIPYEQQIRKKIEEVCAASNDPAHDFLHVTRVVRLAQQLATAEKGNSHVIIPAAYLHDMIIIPKNDPRRSHASRISADAAIEFLTSIDYPSQYLAAIHHAICAHSFSAGIAPETIEAKIVQDADRLDAIGAIGIARCFAVGATLNRPFYHVDDPCARERSLDDSTYTLDHFYIKLLTLAGRMQTESGKQEGQKRTAYLNSFLERLQQEI